MFERCDDNTMAVFDTALAEARRLGHSYVGTEHLLLALMRHREFFPMPSPPASPGRRGRYRSARRPPRWAVAQRRGVVEDLRRSGYCWNG